MELSEYLAVLRRQWRTWVGMSALGLALAAAAFTVTPRMYEATARIFVSPQPSIANSAQYVQARVQSYPGVVTSAAVLTPVIHDLQLHDSVTQLAGSVTVAVPAGTSQLDISVTSGDARSAAAVANAVAQQTTTVVQELETPSSGIRPVTLTVSDPAPVPDAPASPHLVYDLGLGLALGLLLGLAAAVARGRRIGLLHDAKELRAAYGPGDEVEVLEAPRGRRPEVQSARVAAVLAHRLQLAAANQPVRVLVLCPATSGGEVVRRFADEVVAELTADGFPAEVTGPDVADLLAPVGPGVQLVPADRFAAPHTWRRFATGRDGAVLVVPAGLVHRRELTEAKVLLRAAGVRTLATVITPKRGRRGDGTVQAPRGSDQPETGRAQRPTPAEGLPPVPNSAGGHLPVS